MAKLCVKGVTRRSATRTKNAWESPAVLAALIILLTVVTYLPALDAGFVFDDSANVTANRIVKASDGLYRFWFTTEAPDYYPVIWSLSWLQWRLWGGSATGYHVVNVLLHAVNAVLVWIVLRRLKIPGAWLAGCVFALHPVNVATAAWVSEQKNTLSMCFYLGAILFYLRFDEDNRWRWYWFSLAAFLLALLSKTAVVMLPVVLLGCVWWLRGRVRWHDFLRTVPFFVLSLVLGLVTVWFQHNRAMGGHAVRAAGFASRLAVAGWEPWFYLYKAVLPLNLMMIYPRWDVDGSVWVNHVPGIILISCFLVFWWRRKTWGRPWLFGLGYFVVMLLPVLGFVDQGFYRYSLVADHWQYYSIVGAIALAVATVETIFRRMGERGRSVGVVAGVALLVALGAATSTRCGVYETNETLWLDTLAKNPQCWLAHYNLGVASGQAGKIEAAIAHYEQALRIKPDDAEVHNNLGLALCQVGKAQEAIGHYEQALRINPDFAEAYNNLALALCQAGKVQEAMGKYEQALRINPNFAEAHYNLAAAWEQGGRLQDAIVHYEQALRVNPDFVEAHNDLGVALGQVGRFGDAIGHFEQALRINPNMAEAHNNLGFALGQVGRVKEAIARYEQALRINPDYVAAHYNLGIALEQTGKREGAIRQYEQALRVKPDFAQAQNKLAQLRAVQ
jgi:tetratricopeptide (TPR) repeat protein